MSATGSSWPTSRRTETHRARADAKARLRRTSAPVSHFRQNATATDAGGVLVKGGRSRSLAGESSLRPRADAMRLALALATNETAAGSSGPSSPEADEDSRNVVLTHPRLVLSLKDYYLSCGRNAKRGGR